MSKACRTAKVNLSSALLPWHLPPCLDLITKEKKIKIIIIITDVLGELWPQHVFCQRGAPRCQNAALQLIWPLKHDRARETRCTNLSPFEPVLWNKRFETFWRRPRECCSITGAQWDTGTNLYDKPEPTRTFFWLKKTKRVVRRL